MDKNEDIRRAFTVDGTGDYYIAQPSADDIKGSEWQYAKYYSKCLTEGIATTSEMYDILKRRGVIGDAHDKKIEELKEAIGNKIVEMELSSDIVKREKLAKEVSSLREDLFQWNQRINGPLSQTCEQLSEDEKIEYLTSRMIQNKDGSRLWESYDAYRTEKNRTLAFRSRFETMLFLQGLSSDFLDKTPENVVLREIEELKQKDLAKKLEEEGAKESEPEAPTKKRRTKKDKEQ